MLINLNRNVIPQVSKEQEKLLKDFGKTIGGKILLILQTRLEELEKHPLEILLQTELLDEIRKEKYMNLTLVLYELRVTKKKMGNIRVFLCGIKEVDGEPQKVITLHIVMIWKKKLQKIPEGLKRLAIKRCKSIFKI